MNRPNADELMGFALEASELWGSTPIEERPGHMSAMARAHSSLDNIHAGIVELSKGDSKAARPWLLRALYLIGGALAAGKTTTPEEPREEHRYTRAEVDDLLGRVRTDLGMLGMIYHNARNEADANLRRALAAEAEVREMRGQIERLLKKGGA